MGPSELLLVCTVAVLIVALVADVASRIWEEVQDLRFERSLKQQSVNVETGRPLVRTARR